jgi:hypothetical protein
MTFRRSEEDRVGAVGDRQLDVTSKIEELNAGCIICKTARVDEPASGFRVASRPRGLSSRHRPFSFVSKQ